jgi:hypothetical protein
MSKHVLIPRCVRMSENCKTCMLNKITSTPFKSVERKSKILELIHSDRCDFHSTPSFGNKKYVITFIDVFPCFVMYIASLIPLDMGLSFVYM